MASVQKSVRRLTYGLCLGWAVVLLVAEYVSFAPLVRQELALVDWRFRLRGAQAAPDDIVVVAIDERSLNKFTAEEMAADPELAWLQSFPFPRALYARLIDRLCEAGARTVALDLLFTTPRAGDEVLQAAITRHAPRVVLAANFTDDGRQVMTPVFDAPGRVGFVNFWPDADGTVRRAVHETTLAAQAGLPAGEDEPRWRSFGSLAAGVRGPPGLIQFVGGAGSFRSYPLYELLYAKTWERNLERGAVFRDKIVLVGPMGNFQHDQHPTPFGVMNGVEIHANAIATLLHSGALAEAPRWLGQVCLVALALATAIVVQATGNPLAKLGWLVGLMGAYGALTFVSFRLSLTVWPVAGPWWAVAGGGVLGLATQIVAEQLEKRRLRLTLERYVSKPVADEILARSEQYTASLGGQRKAVTILFSDIRGFTTASEQADPAQLVAQLNEYLTAMVEVVMRHEGTLDKFIGDAIMAVFGAPIGRGAAEDAWRAVQTAHEMRMRLAELQQQWQAAGRPVWRIGVGLNHGEVIVGDIGSPQRTEYTVIGDPVNVAARVEGLNKEFGTDILLTEAVYELVKERVEVKLAGTTTVKGRAQPVAVYALVEIKSA